jgi:hypothetical protein
MRNSVSTEGQNRLGLAKLCQEHADSMWVPDHLTPEQAEHFVMDHFRRLLIREVKVLEVKCVEAAC